MNKLYTVHCDFRDGSRSTYDGLMMGDLLAIVGTLDNLDVIECSIEPTPDPPSRCSCPPAAHCQEIER